MDYLVAGNVMVDIVRFADGSGSDRKNMGGPSVFAYSGVKLWTDSSMLVCKVGEDFYEYFDEWLEKNNVVREGIKVVCDYCNHSFLVYKEDGTYMGDPERFTKERHRSDWIQDFGYMKTTPEDIGEFSSKYNIKGVYLAQNNDYVWWRKFSEIKKRDGFKFMWEIEAPCCEPNQMEANLNALKSTDIFSINVQEACSLFEVDTEEECIEKLKQLPVDVTIFRVGKKGLYSIAGNEVFFLPSAPADRVVDPTGCGNTSTGSAMYAYSEGHDPLMIGIMANVASAQNIRQFGVIPDFDAVREFAYKQAKELYDNYKK
ncbi:MAG: carbohydrate kinase family protein [Ruminococcaceae bacterium]|nr:carbohydrate kinase family protein [Oscillospiraceae bacterium]